MEKKRLNLPAFRVSERERNALDEYREVSGESLTSHVVASSLAAYNRGYAPDLAKVKKLIGKKGELREGKTNHDGVIVDVVAPSLNDEIKYTRPVLYVQLHNPETRVSSIGLWGYGSPLSVFGKLLYVEDFLFSTRRSCDVCGLDLTKSSDETHVRPVSLCKTCVMHKRTITESVGILWEFPK